MKIDGGRIINDFIEPNKYQYAIPVYQRNYEWSRDQCLKLFEDILQAYRRDKNHFIGQIVYAPLKEEHGIHYYMIVDGQQRLTTIYLLLKALRDCAKTERERELIDETLFNHDKFDKFAVESKSPRLILTRQPAGSGAPSRGLTRGSSAAWAGQPTQ